MTSGKQRKEIMSITLSSRAKKVLEQRASRAGMNRSKYIEFLVRQDAGVPLKDPSKNQQQIRLLIPRSQSN